MPRIHIPRRQAGMLEAGDGQEFGGPGVLELGRLGCRQWVLTGGRLEGQAGQVWKEPTVLN